MALAAVNSVLYKVIRHEQAPSIDHYILKIISFMCMIWNVVKNTVYFTIKGNKQADGHFNNKHLP